MFTSEEDKISILESLKDTYYELCDLRKTNTVLINIIVQKAGFKNEHKEAIFKLFGVKKYADIVAMIPVAKILSDRSRKEVCLGKPGIAAMLRAYHRKGVLQRHCYPKKISGNGHGKKL